MYLKDMKPGMIVAYRKSYGSVYRARIESLDRSGGTGTEVEISYGRTFENREFLASWVASYDLLSTWEEYKQAQKDRREAVSRRKALQEKVEGVVAETDLKCPVTVKGDSIIITGDLDALEMLALDLEAALKNTTDGKTDALGEIFS